MVYLVKGSGWINLNTIVNNALLFLLAIAFANLLPKETYGVYRYILSVCSILLAVNLSGINTSAEKAVAQGYEGAVIDGYKTRIKWGLLAGLGAALVGVYYFVQGNPFLGKLFLIAAVFLPFFQSANIYSSYLLGKKRFKTHTKYRLIFNISHALFMLGAIFLTDNLLLIILVYFAGQALVNNSLLFNLLKKFRLNRKKDPQAITYGKHLSLMNVINIIASYVDRILIFHFAGAAQMAVYSFAILIPEQLKSFFGFIEILAFPKWSRAGSKEIKTSIRKKIFFSLSVSIILIIVYYFSAPFIYKIFFPQYEESIFLSRIFIFSFLNVAPTFIITALMAKARIKELYAFNIINPLLQITLIVIMGIYFGILGVVLARVSARIASSFVSLLFYKKI